MKLEECSQEVFAEPIAGYWRVPDNQLCARRDGSLRAIIVFGDYISHDRGAPLFTIEWRFDDDNKPIINIPACWIPCYLEREEIATALSSGSISPDGLVTLLRKNGYSDMAVITNPRHCEKEMIDELVERLVG